MLMMGDDTRINISKSTMKNENHLLIVGGQTKQAMANKKVAAAEHWKTIPKDSPMVEEFSSAIDE